MTGPSREDLCWWCLGEGQLHRLPGGTALRPCEGEHPETDACRTCLHGLGPEAIAALARFHGHTWRWMADWQMEGGSVTLIARCRAAVKRDGPAA